MLTLDQAIANKAKRCDAADCRRPKYLLGWCPRHYRAWHIANGFKALANRNNKSEAKLETDAVHIRSRSKSETKAALYAAQDGCCAICSAPLITESHLDHDHKCCPGGSWCDKCVRGLLCRGCNLGIGYFKESLDNMLSATIYLLQHRKESREPVDIEMSA